MDPNHTKHLRARVQLAKNFKKFQETETFNLKVYRLKLLENIPTFEEGKAILGELSRVELDSLIYEILPSFKHWKGNDYNWRSNLDRVIKGLEPYGWTAPPDTILIGTYAHSE